MVKDRVVRKPDVPAKVVAYPELKFLFSDQSELEQDISELERSLLESGSFTVWKETKMKFKEIVYV